MKEENKNLINRKIGERLKQLRQSKKLRQVEMSEIFGISVAAYSKIETGINELTTKHLLTLKKEFKISIDWLLTGDSSKEFGKYEEDVNGMIANMKTSKMLLHSVLSHYFGMIDKVLKPQNRQDIEEV